MKDKSGLGFGIVGCGMIGQFHAQAIAAMNGGHLECVLDLRGDSATKLADSAGVTAYADYDEFLRHPGLDVVTIGTPSGSHMDSAVRAAEAGRVLTEDELLRDNVLAIPILTETDPDGDDWGATSTYSYPRGFPPNVLDATYLEVAEDDSTTYFRAEFAALAEDSVLGFGPTMVAFAISTQEGGEERIGRGAQYRLPPEGGYEYIVWVGDGLQMEDARGRVIAEVAPGRGSVFEAESAALVFALPRRVMPRLPNRSRVTLLVGARTRVAGRRGCAAAQLQL